MSQPTVDDLIKAEVEGDEASAASILAVAPELADEADMFGARAIHAAFYSNHPRLVAMLLEAGVVRDAFLAAELGDVVSLREHLERDPRFVGRMNAGGMTGLHLACYWGALDAARVLLDAGADACRASEDSFLKIHPLGSAVATPNVPNPSDDEDRVLDLVNLLLDHGAAVNARRRDGLTALHTAAYRGHLKVIGRLIERGADPHISGHDDGGPHAGHTPLAMAISQHRFAAARLLEEIAIGRAP